MNIKIDYLETQALGRITASDEISSSVWNRIKDSVIGIQPNAEIIDKTITADWSTILACAPKLAYLRKEYGFKIEYNDIAKQLLQKFRDEFMGVRTLDGSLKLSIPEEEIPQKLIERNFTERRLKPYQIRDLAKMIGLANSANFSVPGAGKTTVAFAAHVLTRDESTRLLVVAPKNAFAAWDEVVQDCMDTSVRDSWVFTRLIGGADSIRSILRTPPMRMLISYEQLTRVQEMISRLLSNYKVHIILDESHRMKSGDRSQRGSVLLKLAHLPIRRDILSGTPIPRALNDIIPQLDFIWPGQLLGLKTANAEDPHEILKDLYVRTTKHELGLPKIEREFIPVQMSPAQMALYGIIRQEAIKQLSGIKTKSNVDLNSAKKSIMRLLQIASNPILVVKRLTEEKPETFPYQDPKIEAIFKSIVEEADSPKILKACEIARNLASKGQKCVIWSSFTENVERIAELISDLGATYIHGGINTGDSSDTMTREGRIKAFHEVDGPCKVLVANPAACSEGISLHRVCHHAIYVDRSYNAAYYLQSVDRIHRLGLEPNTTTYIHVLESVSPNIIGSIDYSVRRRLIVKLRMMNEVLRDFDLHRLALDEEEEDAPIDYDITFEDLADIIEELVGKAQPPDEEEVE